MNNDNGASSILKISCLNITLLQKQLKTLQIVKLTFSYLQVTKTI